MSENALGPRSIDSRRLVLVVEDDRKDLESLCAMLSGSYELVTAQTGGEALTALYQHRDLISLMLLDLHLPDMHGFDILRQVKSDPLLTRIPVIMAASEREAEIDSLNHGAIDFLPKPYPQPGVVLARVNRTIEFSEDRSIIRAAERDPLTGLYRKDFFFKYAEQYDNYHRSLAMDALLVDINHFHMINERYGKAYGDDVLRRIGERLRRAVTDDGGIVCRREGDTFLIYCPHREDYQAILEQASDGLDSRVRLRMGVYANVDKGIDIERRFDHAKVAAGTVRDSFTKVIAMYDDALRESELYTEQLLEAFPRAIAEKQFVVVYQPKFDIRTSQPLLDSAEALVRWNHPQLGMISPGKFVPQFETNGLIQQLDSYVWREVAAQMREWKTRLGFCVPVSVNVSRVDLFDTEFVDNMKRLIGEFDLSPDEFLLEITESAYTQDSDQVIRTVNQLREAGFHIEMDDFGSGYSSLNMISSLPVDALKLDMQFLHNAFKERKNTRMLDIVIDIACSLEVPTIAEGVETAEQMFALKKMGCDIVQGYYFSRPIPAAEYERFLIERMNAKASPLDERQKSWDIRSADQITYEALHDPQTGLYNHSAYRMLLRDADQKNIALLLANVDDYEIIRARDGSQVADGIALRVAKALRRNFRSVDFVCRISNDEFVVIMTRVNSSMRKLVADKVELVNSMLLNPQDGLPAIGLSVGVAFADRDNPQGDIFHDADIALSRMKDMKRCGCAIF